MSNRSRKFLSYYKPYLGLLFADVACAFVLSAVALLLPLCTSYITKYVLPGNMPDMLNQIYIIGAIMMLLVVIHTLCNMFIDYRGHMMGAMMESDMRRELFEHYQKLSFGFYDEQKTGQLMSRLTNDLFWLSELYHHAPEDLAITLLKFSGVLIILFMINVQLSLIIFLFLPIMAFYAFYFNKKMNRALAKSKERIGDINAQVEDALGGIRVVKSFVNESVEKTKFAYENQRFVNSRSDGYISEAFFSGGMIAFTQLITIAVVIFGAISIVRNSLDLADLLTYVLCVGILIEPIQRLVNFSRLFQEGITGFHRFMDIMEIQPDINDAPDATELSHVQGHIVFENVSFKYQQDQDDVLKNVSLNICAGEYIALVGYSGVGKTTLCSLIPRFYDVDSGQISIDGIDVRDMTKRSLRQQIGIVQQDVFLFTGTLRENIAYGNLHATNAEIEEAARRAHLIDFIDELPEGYETQVGERGLKLSGGQKQRIAIARMFLKNPPILILDEATSALDTETEMIIQEALTELAKDRTTLVIAHRLATIKNADRIMVVTKDGIAEEGSHEELLKQGGIFAQLHNVQMK